jgi:hypothetical protein
MPPQQGDGLLDAFDVAFDFGSHGGLSGVPGYRDSKGLLQIGGRPRTASFKKNKTAIQFASFVHNRRKKHDFRLATPATRACMSRHRAFLK